MLAVSQAEIIPAHREAGCWKGRHETWVRGMGTEFSTLKHVSYAWLWPSHFAALCLSFLKLENVCKAEVCIKLLAQLLACGWHSTGARDGGHLYYYEMGKLGW